MELQEFQREGVVVIVLTGKLDINTVELFNHSFAARVEEGQKLFVIDMNGVNYISSAGLRGVLVAVKKCESAGGRLFLNGLHGTVHDAFQLSGFLRYFQTFACREDAVTAAAGG